MKLEKRNVILKLTDEEKVSFGKMAGDLNAKLNDIATAFDHIKKDWKGRLENVQNELHVVLIALKTGQREANVECSIAYDKLNQTIQYIYNGEIVEERPITDDERQIEIE